MDIVERLRFDATRCELQFSKGVATNIEEAANEITRLRAERDRLREALKDIASLKDEDMYRGDDENQAAYLARHALEQEAPNKEAK